LNQAFFIQLAVSGAAVAAMVALAAWANIARPTLPLDEARARRQLAEEFPGRGVEGLWIAVDGLGAVAKSGAMALVLCRLGDGYVARQIPWAQALAASFKDGRISIDLADVAAPRAVITLDAWPPKGLQGDRSGRDRAA
jgi:HAMP domain-containing protein